MPPTEDLKQTLSDTLTGIQSLIRNNGATAKAEVIRAIDNLVVSDQMTAESLARTAERLIEQAAAPPPPPGPVFQWPTTKSIFGCINLAGQPADIFTGTGLRKICLLTHGYFFSGSASNPPSWWTAMGSARSTPATMMIS